MWILVVIAVIGIWWVINDIHEDLKDIYDRLNKLDGGGDYAG